MGKLVETDVETLAKENLSLAAIKALVPKKEKKTRKPKMPTLIEMAKLDKELADFIRVLNKFDLREKGVAALEKAISRKASPTV